jgi:hypothetical protein
LPLSTQDTGRERVYESTEEASISLLLEEEDVFSQVPIILSSELLSKDQKQAEKLHVVLNTNSFQL